MELFHTIIIYAEDDNDKWKGYQMEVSADEYYELEGKQQLTVLCYPRTKRVFKNFCDFTNCGITRIFEQYQWDIVRK